MNCQEFDAIAADLALDRMMEAGEQHSALAHAGGCARCNTRLGHERTLGAGLRALAEADSGQEAPERLETALLAAFRARSAGAPAVAAPVVEIRPRPSAERSAARWAWGAAAAALALASLIVVRFGHQPPAVGSVQPPSNPAPVRPTPPVGPSPPSPPGGGGSTSQEISHTPGAVASPRLPATTRAADRAAVPPPPPAAKNPERPAEITTDFYPLVDEQTLTSMESGQIVRVELPRSALASVGLPMNAERANERIKADVVLGHDGVARAIRFVR